MARLSGWRGGGHGSTGEVVGDEVGVAADAVDGVAVAGVLEALTEHVEPGQRCDTAPVADLAVLVQHGHVQPRVGAAVAGRPHHGVDAPVGQVEPVRCRCRPERRDRVGRRTPRRRGRCCRCGGRSRPARDASDGRRLVVVLVRSSASRTCWRSIPVTRPVSCTPASCRVAEIDRPAVGTADELE